MCIRDSWWATTTQQTWSLRGELLLTFHETPLSGGNGSSVVERRIYDDAGRQTQRLQYFPPGNFVQWVDNEGTLFTTSIGGWLSAAELTNYDDDGRLLTQVQRNRSDAMTRRSTATSGLGVDFPTWILAAEDLSLIHI